MGLNKQQWKHFQITEILRVHMDSAFFDLLPQHNPLRRDFMVSLLSSLGSGSEGYITSDIFASHPPAVCPGIQSLQNDYEQQAQWNSK